ncbi:hypothetical protein P5V15_009950 [Pogonomyrmex californicus]
MTMLILQVWEWIHKNLTNSLLQSNFEYKIYMRLRKRYVGTIGEEEEVDSHVQESIFPDLWYVCFQTIWFSQVPTLIWHGLDRTRSFELF